jgi:hypothetical protein
VILSADGAQFQAGNASSSLLLDNKGPTLLDYDVKFDVSLFFISVGIFCSISGAQARQGQEYKGTSQFVTPKFTALFCRAFHFMELSPS